MKCPLLLRHVDVFLHLAVAFELGNLLGKLSEGDVEVGEADFAIVLLVYFDEVVAAIRRALDDTRGFARLELSDLAHREAVVATGKIDQARVPHLWFTAATATKLGRDFGKLAIAARYQPRGFALQLIGRFTSCATMHHTSLG